jgi:hypothetical protein
MLKPKPHWMKLGQRHPARKGLRHCVRLGILRNAADVDGYIFAKLGRPTKS